MTNAVLLDNVNHKDLRVKTGYSADFGDDVNMVAVFPTEFTYIQREYPILFRRDPNEGWQAVALLGLDRGENLFLDDSGWNARYVPAVQQRGPFLIGLHSREGAPANPEPMIHVDLEHPRVSDSEGEPVFLRHGGNSPYLERVSQMLRMIYRGADLSRAMFSAFEEAGLIESMEVKVNLDERTQYTLPDFFTIDADRLAALDGTSLERLNRLGFLELAVLVTHSLGNIEWLIELKNRKRTPAPA